MPGAGYEIVSDDIFEHIIAVAEDFWTYLHRKRPYYHLVGHVTVWKEWTIRSDFIYTSSNNRYMRLEAIVARGVRYRPHELHQLLIRANAAVANAKVFLEELHALILVQANERCPRNEENIPDVVRDLFDGFKEAINHEALRAAIGISGGHPCGFPLWLFDDDQTQSIPVF